MVMMMFKKSMIVFLKELKCIVRDTKTFVFGLLLPLLLVPGILFIINLSFKSMFPEEPQNTVVKVAFSDDDNAFHKFCSSQSNISIVETKNYEQALNSGEIDVYVNVDSSLDQNILKYGSIDFDQMVECEYNSASMSNTTAKVSFSKYEIGFQKIIESLGESGKIDDVEDIYNSVAVDLDTAIGEDVNEAVDIKADINLICFTLLVPTMIILYCGTSSMGTATELGVGEKERGTLESLLSTGANRGSIVLGKLFATTVMGALGGICAILGLWIYMKVMFWEQPSPIDSMSGLCLVLITICTALFFSSINLAISIYSKSYKESQTYALPVVMACMAPTFFTYTLNPVDINIAKLCIPMYNVACVLKEIMSKSVNVGHVIFVMMWLIVYSLIAVIVMMRLFKKESVIFRI